MSNYINTQTLAYPVSEMEIRKEFPTTSFPVNNFTPPSLYATVMPTPKPEYNVKTQVLVEDTPKQVGKGKNKIWSQTWTVRDLTQDELDRAFNLEVSMIQRKIQERLDMAAIASGYDSILSACTYATSTVEKFREEGQSFVNLRDTVWATCYTILGEVKAGTRQMPESFDAIAAELNLP